MILASVLRGVARSGEKYLVWTAKDSLKTLRAAGGAGFVTAGMVVFKFAILCSKFPQIAETVLMGFNYASSFMLMQGFGFRLATKEPSVLAVVVNRRLRSACPRRKGMAVVRAMGCAILGNLLWVSLGVVGFHFAYAWAGGGEYLSLAEAQYTFESLHPFHTGTLFFAALTGVWLWISSALSAWISHRVRRLRIRHGWRERGGLFAVALRTVAPHSYGISFNLILASFLVTTPVLGRFFGMGLDVRHFTLSSGALVLSLCRLGLNEALSEGLGLAVLSVAMVCLLNCLVSFLCALCFSRQSGVKLDIVSPGAISVLGRERALT